MFMFLESIYFFVYNHFFWKLYIYYFVSFTNGYRAASLADSSPASLPLPLRVEPKPKSGIRQQDLLKKVVEIKPKRPRSESNKPTQAPSDTSITNHGRDRDNLKENDQFLSRPKKFEEHPTAGMHDGETKPKVDNSGGGGLLGLAYTSSDDDDE
ncbi:unnamed protein product [Lathyrus sativus]|nr:unnamed protein product [Lathyrus sativus]